MKLAAIDIGSNSIKLVVVDAAASDSFAVLVREKEAVRLGHETLLKGYLGRPTVLRAATCIKRFRSIAEARGAEKVITVATASVREANNSANFIKAIEQKTGVRVEVLSGIEEARLIGLAAAQGCGDGKATLLNIDIGGGSTELSIFRDGAPQNLVSLKLGAVGLSERYIKSDPPGTQELDSLRTEIRAALQRPARELRESKWNAVTGTSGTILAIRSAIRFQSADNLEPKGSETQLDQMQINLPRLIELNQNLASMTSSERRITTGISAQRADIIVSGGLILEGTMRALGVKTVRACDWALREGVIIDRLREWEDQSRPPMPDIADQKLRGVHAVGKRFGYEEAHAHQVARLAERIFDTVASNYHLTRHQRLLLSAAALLHDVGYHIAHEAHHKHSYYLIEHSELTGFSEAERAVIANIARYHKGSGPKDRHPHFASLDQIDRDTVSKLAGILRLADALDRRHDGRVVDLSFRRMRDVLTVQVVSALECEDELAEAERRLDLFQAAFECSVRLNWQPASQAQRMRVK